MRGGKERSSSSLLVYLTLDTTVTTIAKSFPVDAYCSAQIMLRTQTPAPHRHLRGTLLSCIHVPPPRFPIIARESLENVSPREGGAGSDPSDLPKLDASTMVIDGRERTILTYAQRPHNRNAGPRLITTTSDRSGTTTNSITNSSRKKQVSNAAVIDPPVVLGFTIPFLTHRARHLCGRYIMFSPDVPHRSIARPQSQRTEKQNIYPQQSRPPPWLGVGRDGSTVSRGLPGAVFASRLGLSRIFWTTSSNTCFTPTFVFALRLRGEGRGGDRAGFRSARLLQMLGKI